MSQFSIQAFKENGPQLLKTNITQAYLTKGSLKADDFATMQGKAIANIVLTGTDVIFSTSGENLQVDINGELGVDPSGTSLIGDNLSMIYASASVWYLALDVQNRIITNGVGDTVDIPAGSLLILENTTV